MYLVETEAFVQVVRAGGFTAAGRRLGVPKSTLSRQVARLEAQLGVRLLQRTTRSVALTEEGEAYFRRCGPAVDAIEEASRDATEAAGEPRGVLTVAMPFDFARDWFAVMIPRFRLRYPQIQLRLQVSPRRVELVGEGVDVAIRGGVLDDSALVARRLATSQLVFCASPGYLEARGRPQRLADLETHDCVWFASPPGGWPITGPSGVSRLSTEGWLQVNEWGTLRVVALAGAGVGLIEAHSVLHDLQQGRLERVLPEHAVVGGGLFAVFPSSKQLSPRVRVFVDFLVEQIDDLWPARAESQLEL